VKQLSNDIEHCELVFKNLNGSDIQIHHLAGLRVELKTQSGGVRFETRHSRLLF
jgi:hypothetical protein